MSLETKLNKVKDRVLKGGLIAALGGSIFFSGCGTIELGKRDVYRIFGGGIGAAIDEDNPWRGALIGIVVGNLIYNLEKGKVRRRRIKGVLYYEDSEGKLYKRMKMDPVTKKVYPPYYRYDPVSGRKLKDVYVPVER